MATLIIHLTNRMAAWLYAHEPVRCQVCFRWLWRKAAIWKPITTGGLVPLCAECDRSIFKPFSSISRN